MLSRRNLINLIPSIVLLVNRAAHGQPGSVSDSQSGSSIVAQSRFAVTDAPAQSELVSLVVDFPAGAWTSLHTHGGQAINLVLAGEITLRQGGVDRPHRVGQAWTDSSGILHAAGNTGAGRARLLTNFLLPKGAPQTTAVQDAPLEPTVTHEARFSLPPLPAETEIVQQVVELASDWHAERTYGSFAAHVVLEGEVEYRIGANQRTYRAGEAWLVPAGALVTGANRSAGKARVFTTYLLPKS
jgi:quercetin dioxygenase-like cupin family protein